MIRKDNIIVNDGKKFLTKEYINYLKGKSKIDLSKMIVNKVSASECIVYSESETKKNERIFLRSCMKKMQDKIDYAASIESQKRFEKQIRASEKDAKIEKNIQDHNNFKLWHKRFINSIISTCENHVKIGEHSQLGERAEWCVKVVDDYVAYSHSTSKIFPRLFSGARATKRNTELGEIRVGYKYCYKNEMDMKLESMKHLYPNMTLVVSRRPFDTDTYNAILSKWEGGSKSVGESRAADSGLTTYCNHLVVNDKKGVRYRENYSVLNHDVLSKIKKHDRIQYVRDTYEMYSPISEFADWKLSDLENVAKFDAKIDEIFKNEVKTLEIEYFRKEKNRIASSNSRKNETLEKAQERREKNRIRNKILRDKRKLEKGV